MEGVGLSTYVWVRHRSAPEWYFVLAVRVSSDTVLEIAGDGEWATRNSKTSMLDTTPEYEWKLVGS